MNMRSFWLASVGGALLLAAPAFADDRDFVLTPVDPPVVVPASEPPRPVCPERQRPCIFSHLALAIELGGGAFEEGQPFAFGEGTGSGTSPGPSWGLRVGWEFTRWLAIDAHYIGMGNEIHPQYAGGGGARLITNAAALELRLTLPTPYVQPYILGGAGFYGTVVSGRGTAFNNSTQPGFPMGVGVQIPVSDHLSLGAEATYHFQLGEAFSSNDQIAGGDLTTFNAMLRVRL